MVDRFHMGMGCILVYSGEFGHCFAARDQAGGSALRNGFFFPLRMFLAYIVCRICFHVVIFGLGC